MERRLFQTGKRIIALILTVAMVAVGLYVNDKKAEAGEMTEVTILSLHQFSQASDDGRWRFWFNVEQSLSGMTFTNGDINVEVNGEAYSRNPNASVDGKYLLFQLYGKTTAPEEGETFTIKAGTGTNNNVNISEEFTLVYHDGAWEEYVEKTEVTILSLQQFNQASDDGRWRFWFNVEQSLSGITFSNGDINVEVNGETYTRNPNASVDGNYLLFQLYGKTTAPEEGETFTIKAGTGTNNNVNISEEYTIIYHDGAWEKYVETTDITIVKFQQFQQHSSDNHWRIWMDIEETLETDTQYQGLIVEINGSKYTGSLQVQESSSHLLFVLWSYNAAPAEGDTFTIKAGTGTNDNGNIAIAEDYTLVYHDGAWEKYVETTDITITGVKQQSYNNGWFIWLGTEETLPDGSFEGLTIEGGGYTSYQILKDGNWLLVLLWGYSQTPAEGATITIKAGIGTSENGNINIPEDYTIECYNGVWAEKIEATNLTITGLYSQQQQGDGHWRFVLDTSVAVPEGSYSGVKIEINGETYAGGLEVLNNGTRLWVVLWNYNDTPPANGSTITIKAGVGTGSNGNIRILEDFTIRYYSGKWIGSLADSGVGADVNGDGEADSRDLVRMLRYNKGAGVAVNTEKVDINYDGNRDEKDIVSLRKVLAGMFYYDKDGMVYGIPQYREGVIEKMAYACPSVGTLNEDGSFASRLSEAEIDAAFQKYKASGLTLLCSEQVATFNDQSFDSIYNEPLRVYLEAAQRNGLGVIVSATYLNNALVQADLENSDYSNWKAVMDDIVRNLSKYKSFRGFLMNDELQIQYAENYQQIATYMTEKYPELLLISSQGPVTAYSAWGPETLTLDTTTNNTKELAYKDYIRNFAKGSNTFTYDLYPLIYDADKFFGITTKSEYAVNEEWFENLKWVSEVKKEQDYGFKMGVTIQSCKLAGTSSIWSQYERYAPTQKEDIGFQMYTAMAYGCEEIHFFTYEDHFTSTSVEEAMNDNASVYNAVATVNAEVDKLAPVFKAFSWRDTLDIAVGEIASSEISTRLESASVTGARTLIGCMKDTDGFDGYMIANAAGPRTTGKATVILEFNNAVKALVYTAGIPELKELENNSCTITVGVGEGVFVIPIAEE